MQSDTTTLGESMHELRLAEDGEALEATITRIDGAAMFNTGWIGQGYLYETPTLYITCETSLGTVQVESHINNIPDSGLQTFLKNAPFDATRQVDLGSIVGETIYLAPRDDKHFATIGWEQTKTRYSENNEVVLRTDSLRDTDEIGDGEKFSTSIEARSINEMDTLLTIEMIRHTSGTHGWIEVPFEYTGLFESHHFFTATINNTEVYWAFEDSIDGVEKIETFLSSVGINYTPEEFSNETIWVKPLRDVHFTNRPEDHCIDTEEFWVASGTAQLPEKNPSFLEKLKSFFSISSGGVEVSVNKGRDRKAKSSRTKKSLTPCTELESEVSFEKEAV